MSHIFRLDYFLLNQFTAELFLNLVLLKTVFNMYVCVEYSKMLAMDIIKHSEVKNITSIKSSVNISIIIDILTVNTYEPAVRMIIIIRTAGSYVIGPRTPDPGGELVGCSL